MEDADAQRHTAPAGSPLSFAWTVVGHLVVGGLLLRVALAGPSAGFFRNDVPARYWPIAELRRPWVEEAVEFPPIAVAFLEPLALVDQGTSVVVHVVVQVVLVLAVLVVLWRGAGRSAVARWALWATPLLPMLVLRVDLPSILACVVALVAVAGRRSLVGGLAMAVGVLAKLWPGALVIGLWWRDRRAAIVGVAASVVGTLAWMLLTTADAPVQVLGFRGAVGWHMESVVGGFVRLVDGGTPAIEQGAWRFGDASVVPTLVLGLVALALSIETARRVEDPARVLLTVLALGLVASPLLSAQYAVWLLPSLALVDDLRPTEAVAAAGVTLGSVAVLWWLGEIVDATALGWTVLLVRNTAVVALAAATVATALRRPRSGQRPGAGPSRPSPTTAARR